MGVTPHRRQMLPMDLTDQQQRPGSATLRAAVFFCKEIGKAPDCRPDKLAHTAHPFPPKKHPPRTKESVRKAIIKEVVLTAGEEANAQKALAARNREQEQSKLRMRRVRKAQQAAKEAGRFPLRPIDLLPMLCYTCL